MIVAADQDVYSIIDVLRVVPFVSIYFCFLCYRVGMFMPKIKCAANDNVGL